MRISQQLALDITEKLCKTKKDALQKDYNSLREMVIKKAVKLIPLKVINAYKEHSNYLHRQEVLM